MEHPENDAQYAGLAVNKGIEQPPTVNPYLKKMRTAHRRTFTAADSRPPNMSKVSSKATRVF